MRRLHARAELEIFGWRRILNRHVGREPSIAFVRHSQTSSIQARRPSRVAGSRKLFYRVERQDDLAACVATAPFQTVFTAPIPCHASLAALIHRRQTATEPMRRFKHIQEFLQDVCRKGDAANLVNRRQSSSRVLLRFERQMPHSFRRTRKKRGCSPTLLGIPNQTSAKPRTSAPMPTTSSDVSLKRE